MIPHEGIYVEFILFVVLYSCELFFTVVEFLFVFYVVVVREDGNFEIKYFLPYIGMMFGNSLRNVGNNLLWR